MARPVPADLEDALAESPGARERFWALPPEELDRWVAYIQRARFPGQRTRRINETVLAGEHPALRALAEATGRRPEPWRVV